MNKGSINILMIVCTDLFCYILEMELLGYKVGMYLTLLETWQRVFQNAHNILHTP